MFSEFSQAAKPMQQPPMFVRIGSNNPYYNKGQQEYIAAQDIVGIQQTVNGSWRVTYKDYNVDSNGISQGISYNTDVLSDEVAQKLNIIG